jgi:DNA ligase (NAD+)
MINRLKNAGLNFSSKEEREVEKLPQVFAGEIWCVTGSFDHFKPRDIAMEEVKKRGGRVSSSVTSKTTHLLAGVNPGSKLDKAQKLNTKVVNEEEFLKRIGI